MSAYIYALAVLGAYEYGREKHPEKKWWVLLAVACAWPWLLGYAIAEHADSKESTEPRAGA